VSSPLAREFYAEAEPADRVASLAPGDRPHLSGSRPGAILDRDEEAVLPAVSLADWWTRAKQ
jgi:hypothetical protein